MEIEKGSNTPNPDDVFIINQTDIPLDEIKKAASQQLGGNPELKKAMKAATDWSNFSLGINRRSNVSLTEQRPGGLYAQNKYVAPDNVYDEFRLADIAVRDDDIVGGAADFTEQFAFREVRLETTSEEETSIWDQIIEDVDLEMQMRKIWREVFTYSTSYIGVKWGRKTYKAQGTTPQGKKTKKQYKNVLIPVGMTTLDPLTVVPWGNFMFGQEDLYYIAPLNQLAEVNNRLANNIPDAMVDLIEKKSELSKQEEAQIGELVGESVDGRLFKLKKDSVFRITATRPDYKAFSDVRLRSVFELLDLKHNMREMDRADILGSLNALIVVKMGDKDNPVMQEDVDQTERLLSGSARVPIIVGDYTVDVEIVTRKTDTVLRPERYNNLDSRITSRIFQLLSTGSYSSGTGLDTSTTLSRIMAASMEARRDDIRKHLMKHVFKRVFERNDQFTEAPVMNFYPKRIDIDFNHHFATQIFDMFNVGTLSRETLLSELGFDIRVEASRLEAESDLYAIFATKEEERIMRGHPRDQVQTENKTEGRVGGGNNNGGGTNQDSFSPSRDPAE